MAFSVAAAGSTVVASSASAAASDIVINELMYSELAPANSDFIELYNRGASAVDITGWAFTAGIALDPALNPDGAFPAGTTIPAGGYLVGAADPVAYQSTYGRAANFSISGSGLSSNGEQVTLRTASATVDANAPVVDDVTYGVAAPWPTSPRGAGPSLELIDPNSDNAQASSWAASSVVNGTPGTVNLPVAAGGLQLSNVALSPAAPLPNAPFTVSAKAPVGSSMSLTYKIMYGADQTVPMVDDASSPGGADDGVFAGRVPGAGAGQLVRYRVSASSNGASASVPEAGDARGYLGVVVTDPARGAKLPVLEMFIPDAVFNDLVAHHRCDGVAGSVALAYNGQVINNASMEIKGHHSCNDTEVKWDVSLPSGTLLNLGTPFTSPVDEFNLESNSVPVPQLGWEMSAAVGQPASHEQTVRVQKNGTFYSIGSILEKYDNVWRADHKYDTWALYKVQTGGLRTYSTPAALQASADIDKKNGNANDWSDVWELTQWLSKPDSPAKRAWLRNNLDMPEMANVSALIVSMRQWDTVTKNFFVARDTSGTGRWRLLQWDLDDIFNGGADPKGGDFVTPPLRLNKLFISLFADPDFTAMHYRRVRTLYDTFLAGNGLIDRFDQLTTPYASDFALDSATWGTRSLSQFRSRMVRAVAERRTQITKHTAPGQVPASQSGAPTLVINELMYNPAGNADGEYVEVANPSATESVDMSGYTIGGPGTYVVPQGTVVLPNGYMVFVKNDALFRSLYPDLSPFVGGQYSGSLANEGEPVTLTDPRGRVVDQVAYLPTAPWPTGPNGNGPSLELTSLTADNSLASSWMASAGTGTPGARNASSVTQPVTSVLKGFGTSWRYLATGDDQGTAWRASGFNDGSWPSGTGDLGFKNANATTIPATAGRITYYFRSNFTLPEGDPVQDVVLNLKRDDGAVVYLNGREVARSNMTASAISFRTLAKTAVEGSEESTPVVIRLSRSDVAVGNNSLAIEVHQRAAQGAADLTLDAQVQVTR